MREPSREGYVCALDMLFHRIVKSCSFSETKEQLMVDSFRRPSLIAGVFYKDPWAALDWLENAFGF